MTAESSTSTRTISKQAIEWLFDRMAFLWGKKFTDQWGGVLSGKDETEVQKNVDKMHQVWLSALAGISELEFRRGATKMQKLDWPVSLPEFLKLCRPEVNPLTAYYEALEGSRSRERGEVGIWSHPAIFWASVRVSTFELMNQSYSQIKTRWEAALAAELEKGNWEPIPAPMIALPSSKKRLSKEETEKVLQHLKAVSGVKPSQADPKGWARKILQRHADGDKNLTPVQVEFARQALRVQEDDDV